MKKKWTVSANWWRKNEGGDLRKSFIILFSSSFSSFFREHTPKCCHTFPERDIHFKLNAAGLGNFTDCLPLCLQLWSRKLAIILLSSPLEFFAPVHKEIKINCYQEVLRSKISGVVSFKCWKLFKAISSLVVVFVPILEMPTKINSLMIILIFKLHSRPQALNSLGDY